MGGRIRTIALIKSSSNLIDATDKVHFTFGSQGVDMKAKEKPELEAAMYLPHRPLFYVTKLIGIKPLRLERRRRHLFILKTSPSDFYYFLFYLMVYALITSYCVYSVVTDDVNYVVISQTVVATETTAFIALLFIILISSYAFRKMLIRASKSVCEVDLMLRGVKIALNERERLRKTKRLLLMTLASVLIRSLLMMATIRVDLIQETLLFVAALMKTLSKYEFVVMILPVSDRFDKINRHISLYPRKNAGNLAETLYLLCRLHYKLCNVSRMINTAFTVQLLFSLAVSLSDILFQSYYLYVALNDKSYLITNWMIACPIAWLIDEIVEIYVLVRACEVTCEHANDTPIILHELRNHLQDFEIEKHIQMYSLQMLHQKIRFSALGFFTIDYSLIYSMAGAVTTYLVIFIQFDQNQKAVTLEGNSTTVTP